MNCWYHQLDTTWLEADLRLSVLKKIPKHREAQRKRAASALMAKLVAGDYVLYKEKDVVTNKLSKLYSHGWYISKVLEENKRFEITST